MVFNECFLFNKKPIFIYNLVVNKGGTKYEICSFKWKTNTC